MAILFWNLGGFCGLKSGPHGIRHIYVFDFVQSEVFAHFSLWEKVATWRCGPTLIPGHKTRWQCFRQTLRWISANSLSVAQQNSLVGGHSFLHKTFESLKRRTFKSPQKRSSYKKKTFKSHQKS